MTETGGDLEMLVGISKHLASLSDNKKVRVSTTLLAMQETLKDKLVSYCLKYSENYRPTT